MIGMRLVKMVCDEFDILWSSVLCSRARWETGVVIERFVVVRGKKEDEDRESELVRSRAFGV